jgi:hypothetical protein
VESEAGRFRMLGVPDCTDNGELGLPMHVASYVEKLTRVAALSELSPRRTFTSGRSYGMLIANFVFVELAN